MSNPSCYTRLAAKVSAGWLDKLQSTIEHVGNTSGVFVGGTFAETIRRISARRGNLQLFIRDDDVDTDHENLHRLADLSIRLEVPISLGVVPAALQDRAADYVASIRQHHPKLIEVHQHGWAHINHEPGNDLGEFGPARSYDQQFEDLYKGHQIMRDVFGSGLFGAFSPPWNVCTPDTARAMSQLGFQVLSAWPDCLPGREFGLREYPATIDFQKWGDPVEMTSPRAVVMSLFNQWLNYDEPVGLLLHHRVMTPQSFAFLEFLLRRIIETGHVTLGNFESLCYQQTHDNSDARIS